MGSKWSDGSVGGDQAEARRLLDLRYRLSALAATEDCQAGLATVVQDKIFGEDVGPGSKRCRYGLVISSFSVRALLLFLSVIGQTTGTWQGR